jgi:hypothetical protein
MRLVDTMRFPCALGLVCATESNRLVATERRENPE